VDVTKAVETRLALRQAAAGVEARALQTPIRRPVCIVR